MPRSLAVAAAVALVALVSGAVAFALDDRPPSSTANGTAMPSTPASPVGGAQGQAAPSPSSPPPSPVPIVAPVSPQASPATSTQTITLTATLDISLAQFGRSGSGSSTDEIGFDVANTGSVASGPLTVAISLPPGSSPGGQPPSPSPGVTGGVPEGTGSAVGVFSGFGWSCQPTSSGVTCTHASVPAGQHADGRLSVTISGFATCGQPVRLTASSGPATAQAVQDLRC